MALAVGGPLHGRYLPDGPASLLVSGETSESVKGGSRRPCITYHRRRMLIRGWRFDLTIYTTWAINGPLPDGIVLPGYVTGVPAEHHPIGCRCQPVLIDNRETEMKP